VRFRLRSDLGLRGSAWCRAQSDAVDVWLTQLLAAATDGAAGPRERSVALVALGGYGRRELAPESDIDVMLLHDRKANQAQIAAIADRLWYPIWDEGFHLGHSVCTLRQALSLAEDTLETATALLSARHVAGDPELSEQLRAGARQNWTKRASRWLETLAGSVQDRHRRAGEAAFLLEPDLKEARGGLRDVHALGWAQAAQAIVLDYDQAPLASAYAVLLDARVELHRLTGRAGNVVHLQDQEAMAAALDLPDADHLMAGIARSARLIAWTSDDSWRRVASTLQGPTARSSLQPRHLAPGVQLLDGEVTLSADADVGRDPSLALRVAVAAASHHSVIERHSLERLAADGATLPEPWPAEAATLFVALLAAGRPAIGVIEALDHRGVWGQILPEWEVVRSRPQHNAYHRFTVDRHLLETVANAAGLVDRVGRPDLLVLGALLHDVGKGHPGDHSTVGVGLARGIATRMGLPEADIATLETLVRHHLLLADVASRRDLSDPVTIERVAAELETVERVRLLAALTEADSLATGPSAWSAWKAGLVQTLADRVVLVLVGDPLPGIADTESRPAVEGLFEGFPSRRQQAWLAQPGRHIDAEGDVLTVVTVDRPGVFSRVAGVLALYGLGVVAASAHSTDDGRALAEYRVVDTVRDVIPWPRVVADLDRALDGRLAISARLAERRRTYDRPTPISRRVRVATVSFDNAASAGATVIDVHAPDAIGVLYRITRALAELDLDIRSARVQTLGYDVVDSFYVRDDEGKKVTDQVSLQEIERAILHALSE
jgi:[protein-PII] uridylyltransferase